MSLRPASPNHRQGLSLTELLVSSAVMGIICLSFGTLAVSVQMANEYAVEKNLVGQHSRAILQRIERHIRTAHANEAFPGVHVISYTDSGYEFPQSIAIWTPTDHASASAYPTIGELTLIVSDPDAPNRLLEVSMESTTAAPSLNSTSSWQSLITSLLSSNTAEIIEISDLVRVGKISDSDSQYYSTLRFDVRVSPSDDELTDARAETTEWESLAWSNSIYSSTTGLRQSWVAFEFQLVATDSMEDHGNLRDAAVPYFGSSALYFQVTK